MIYLIKGDDEVAINNFIVEQKKLCSSGNIYDLGTNFEISGLNSLLKSNALFADDKLVIINPKKKEQIEFHESDLKDWKESSTIKLIVLPKGLNANLGALKTLSSFAVVKTLESARDYTFFNFCDALFGEKNKHKAVELLNSIDDLDESAIPLVSTMAMSLRNFISIKTDNKIAQALHPFMKTKLAKYKLTLEEAKALYTKILQLDIAFKTSGGDKKALLLNFIIL